MYVSASDGALTMAATDSYRLAHYRLPAVVRPDLVPLVTGELVEYA